MIQLILNRNNLLIIVHAVAHHLGECGEQGIDLRHLQLQSECTDNLQCIVQEMRIDLRLQRSQLIGLVR
ncbi:hypothetical protein D3C75_1016970 [compost metagenome]